MRRTLLSLWSWAALVGFTVGGSLLQMAVLALTWPFDRNRLLSGRIFRVAASLGARLNPMWRFAVVGPVPKRSPGRAVVVSNHCSNMDPYLISMLPWEMKWLAKRSLFRVPIVGWSLRLVGDVPVLRGDRGSGRAAMEGCARWLRRDVPVMIFPEGTRSRDGRLQPFKLGAFRLAIETGADILPVAVTGTTEALRKHDWRFGFARARVTVGEPIATAGMTLADVETLAERARAAVEALATRLRADAGAAAKRPGALPRRARPARHRSPSPHEAKVVRQPVAASTRAVPGAAADSACLLHDGTEGAPR